MSRADPNSDDDTQQEPPKDESNGIKFGTGIAYDDAYGEDTVDTELVHSLPTDEERRRDDDDGAVLAKEQIELEDEGIVPTHDSAHPSTRKEMESSTSKDDDSMEVVDKSIAGREAGTYQARRQTRELMETDGMSYKDVMTHQMLDREKGELEQALNDGDGKVDMPGWDEFKDVMTHQMLDREKGELEQALNDGNATDGKVDMPPPTAEGTKEKRRRRRWDDGAAAAAMTPSVTASAEEDPALVSDCETSVVSAASQKSRWDDDIGKPTASAPRRRKRWDETPLVSSGTTSDATPQVASGASKWEDTPLVAPGATMDATPMLTANTAKKRSRWDSTPAPLAQLLPTLPLNLNRPLTAYEKEMQQRNRPWSDEALDTILPAVGYIILVPPPNYHPMRTPARKLLATPAPVLQEDGFTMQLPPEEREGGTQGLVDIREAYGVPIAAMDAAGGDAAPGGLPFIRPDDMQYFGRLLTGEEAEAGMESKEEVNEKKIMSLLLKIKCGTPPQRKTAMRHITDKARTFGAGPIFHQILPLLMSPTLSDQERHLLVKVIDRVLYQLDDLVRPFVHRILAVIEPMLIDEDYYARIEGREIVSNLAKAAGLATMIATMRPDIDNPDEYVRNTTSRAFAVVASALGVPSLLPFLRAVCQSRRSWQARHTGSKIVQQVAVLMGCAVLPYLRELVEIVGSGLVDEQQKVRTMTALTLSALAEASHPYGIESFDSVIRPLWKGAMETHHGKNLAAFLKAIGFVIPLMEEEYASHYTRLVMPILIREFQSPDEEMKRIVLRVVRQCVATHGVDPAYVRTDVLPEFFRSFWIRRMALDRRNHRQVVETTMELANRVGCSDVLVRVVDDLKDDSEPYRRMVMETVQVVLDSLGAGDVDAKLEERLIDGILYAFQEQAVDTSAGNTEGGAEGGLGREGQVMLDGFGAVVGALGVRCKPYLKRLGREGQVMLDGFGAVVGALGVRCKPYLKQIAGTIKWRLNNKSASVRMQAADLIGRCAVVMKACGEDQLMGHLGVVLYEYLGEEYPEVLGSILGALRAIVNVIGMTKMTPPIRDLLPRLTPILRNRHEKVQENCIDLVGRIADRGAEFVSAKEWMRICFELLEMLKAHKKAIRRASVSTFGYIAKAIGPQDVLHTLLNNLKVQDRQMRVCTTVAIAIVAETCGPFTILPALMNEYSVPELNIQNGVLKALSFMFEYIGPSGMAKDYIFAVSPLLEDALMDRDQVHRQTGCATVMHLSLGVAGLGCEDALIHLLNFVWPNVFEESPHVIQAVFGALEGMMVALGPNVILQYVLQGLYHPARKVREVYW
eukprot:CAMPEP_0194395422 /NCGR_PEP_ID=MMETSP0174-20130528/124416_1 /TAXON_ID=216777 /ORGANISM="Proboscia alata, Strain PI-D3" /LENGTH=1309 /DNA_ID=CAMNT_0039191359 /DNA_START=237 /DNA_END=4164 /DNA_ORIENTATION=-